MSIPSSLVEAIYVMCKADKPQVAELINFASMLFHKLHPILDSAPETDQYDLDGARCSLGLHGTKVIHRPTIQSQIRTLHSPRETVVQLP